MTRHNAAQATLAQTARRAPGLFFIRSNACLPLCMSGGPAARLNSLGRLSNVHLRDVGLTEFDVEAACARQLRSIRLSRAHERGAEAIRQLVKAAAGLLRRPMRPPA